jgi:hypothetical protein
MPTRVNFESQIKLIPIESACKYATTTNIPFSSISTIDGFSLATNDRILVWQQTLPEENGIYIVSGGTNLIRANGSKLVTDFKIGQEVFVYSGATNAKKLFYLKTNVTTIGVSPIVYDVVNAGITSYTNPADNRVLTSVSSSEINAEANLTFNGSVLTVNSNSSSIGSSGTENTHRFSGLNYGSGTYSRSFFFTSFEGTLWEAFNTGGSIYSKPPIVAIINNETPSQIKSGLHLMTTNSANNTYAPALTFGADSVSGGYHNVMGAITAKKLSSAYFDNFSTGQLEFFATRPGSNSDVEIVFRDPNMTISTGVGIGYTSAPQVRGRLTVLEKIGINNSTPTVALDVIGAGLFTSNITANSFIKSGGTSSQFLKADGSVDSNTYLTTSSAASTYLPLSGGTLTGGLNVGGGISNTWTSAYVNAPRNNGAYLYGNFYNVRDSAGGQSGGNRVTHNYMFSQDENTAAPATLYYGRFNGFYNQVNIIYDATIYYHNSNQFYYRAFSEVENKVTFSIKASTTVNSISGTKADLYLSGDAQIDRSLNIGTTLGVTGAATFSSSATANSFVKSGGTSSQFLKADGSVDSNTYLTTSSAASTYLPLAGGTLTGTLNGVNQNLNSNLSITDPIPGNAPRIYTSITTGPSSTATIRLALDQSTTGGANMFMGGTQIGGGNSTNPNMFFADTRRAYASIGGIYTGAGIISSGHIVFNTTPNDSTTALTERMRISQDGSITMGGTLGVASDSTLSGDLILRTSGGSRFQTAIRHYYEQQSRYAGEIQFLPEGSSGSALSFITNPSGGGQTERLRITQAGNIGIGTASPSYTLDVNGTFNATSNSLIGGTLGVTGLATLSGDLYNTGNEYFYDNSPNYGLAVKYKVINVYAQSGSQNTSFGFIKQQLVINNAQIYETSDSNYMSLTILNQSDLSVVSTTHYVTYNNATNINSLATAMNNMTISQIGIITTNWGWDYWTNTASNGDTLRAAALNAGLTKLGSSYFHTGGAGSGYMRRYVAVFYGGGGIANVRNRNVIEVLESQSTSARPQAYLYCKIITNGQFASILGSTSTNALYSAEGGYDANIALSANRYGQIGIGTTNPAYQIELSTDSAAKPTTSTWTISSDIRLKENIETADLDRCYDIVNQLPLKRYRWKDDIYGSNQIKDRSKLGWIAQDVESIFPKAVGITPFKYNRYNTTTKPVLDLDGSNIYDENGNIVYETIKEIISEETIEDCKDLNVDQIYAVMYGTIKKLINIVEDNKTQIDMLKIEIDNLKSMN